jgi:hypothetical protein
VVFNKDEIFSSKTKDLIDNLMHSTLNEIVTWIRSVELLEPTHAEPETQSFYEDNTVIEPEATLELSDQPGYSQGRKVGYAYPYPTPPSTLLPVSLLTNLLLLDQRTLATVEYPETILDQGTLQSIPWKAAFIAGLQGGTISTYQGKTIDKA